MKKYFLLFLPVLFVTIAFSQTKPKQKEKPPTQKEMEAMMKEMQQTMNEMSPEEKRAMDSMGIKIPSLNNVPKMSDKQLSDAFEEENRIVPKKDVARISSIPKTITDAKMQSYITAIQNKLASVLKPAVVSTGNEVYNYIKSKSKNVNEAANMAIGLWIDGKPEIALYVLGKICVTDAANTDNLSNFSAMLSMQGAQHLAIPILNNLNAKYPNNSTLLNNLGQAWFGLGEIGKAEKYLDSTIRIYAYHPQANLTKSLIEESKGNKQKAIEAVKRSVAKAYSMEKENRLNKLGYQLKPKDMAWDRPMPQDALGLEKFKWPEYPMNVGESKVLEAEWDAFTKACEDALHELNAQLKILEKAVEQSNEVRTKQLLQAGQRGIMMDPLPPLAHKAMAKLSYLVDDKDGHISFSYQKKGQAVANANIEVAKFEDILSNQLSVLEKKYEDQFGEGKPNPFEAACADDTKAKNGFLNASNSLLRDANNDFLAFMRHKINNETYYNQYTMWPENFEFAKVLAKISWLNLIKSQKPKFKDKSGWCQNNSEEEYKPFQLQEFDDIACEYKSSLNLGCLKLETKCSQTITTYGCGQVSFTEREIGQNYVGGTLKLSPKIKVGGNEGPLSVEGSIGGDFVIELDKDNQVKEWKGTVTVKGEAGVGVQTGPVKIGASVSEALEIEMGSKGITDINIVTAGKVEAGIAAPEIEAKQNESLQEIDKQINKGIGYVNKGIDKLNTSVEIGVECRTSLVSGHISQNGTGILSGVRIPGL